MLYALERELFPLLSLHWNTPSRIRYCLDDDLPLGAAHHQKIVTVDDALAFVGGFDLTVRRWDNSEHRFTHACRIDPSGEPYLPYHDVQAVIDGKAARALAELVRKRWERGACNRPPPMASPADRWPDSVQPDLTDIDVGIARTYPAVDDEPEIREVEALSLRRDRPRRNAASISKTSISPSHGRRTPGASGCARCPRSKRC